MRCLALAAALLFSLHAQSTPAASPDYFELKIRPLLATNCYSCHTDSALGGLRLDSRESMLKGGSRGPSLVPGDPEKSILIQAVRQTDPKLKMPMGSKLKDSQVEDLAAWVKAGATWPKSSAPITTTSGKYVISPERKAFWSLVPLKDPQPPPVRDAKWPKSPIDKFILARLEKDGMKPVRPANKHDLLRRATLDLTGLPPTPEEIAAFDKDASPDAFAKVVDRLLASPHYGERWGREWLDVARFGEDDYRSLNPFPRGYFPYANAYLYRDWVIQAFNDDLPYDQFVKAQLAGDALPENVRYKYLPATGFLGLGPWYFDNGAVEVTRADERHDRVDVVTRGFLGLTVACARCHDHKYDPIPQTDYYSLAGVFKNTAYREYPLAPRAVVEEHLKIEAEVEKKEKVLQEMQTALSNSLSESLAFQTVNYLEAVYEVAGQKKEKDAVVEARKLDYELLERWITYLGKTTDKYHEKEALQALIKKAVPVTSTGEGGRGGRGGGGGGKSSVNPEVKKAAEEFQANVVKMLLARKELDDENQVITAKSLEGTTKKKRANKPNEFITNDDFCPGCGLRLKNMTEQESNFWTEIFLRELRDSDDPTVDAANGAKAPKPGVLLFKGWGLESRVGPEAQARMASIKADIEAAKKKLDPSYPYIHGVADVEKPSDLELALRGNPNTLGDKVPRHFLSVLSKDDPQPFKHGSGRLELADDILKQPIAMRVIVNRIWKGHFGTGIVDTPSNFGIGGERPTNPELLDFLASQFVKDGMSIKKLHRTIMLSATYQLSADNDQVNFAKDAGDRLYWRVERKRMDAEQIRDAVLMVAGNLDNSLGGPSRDLSPAFTRRTVYGKVSRYKLDEYLQLFDFPSPNISAEKRFTTTVPLQRLFLMNSDFMQIESEELAKRVAAEPDNRARIRKVYMLAYGRDPSEEEIKLGLDYLHAEPMREYEEEKNKPPETGGGRGGTAPFTGAAKPEPTEGGAGAEAAPVVPEMGMGMFGGMAGRGGRGGATPEVKYEPTAWGRYIKVLLSSSEFVFIN
jgi:cytochrome c553